MMFTAKKDYIDQLDALLEDPSVQRKAEPPEAAVEFGVLVAITDDDLAPPVTAVARALQERRNARPSVLYVIEISASVPEASAVAVVLEDELRDPRIRAKQEGEMRAVLHIDGGALAAWPFGIAVGSVAPTVVEHAKREGAEMIVMGLNRHAVVGRVIGKDTVREVMALGGVPVLAVRPPLTTLPKRIVVAVDFSRASVRAAHLARRLVDEHGSMHLLFVESGVLGGTSESAEGQQLIQAKGLEAAFNQLVSELKPLAGMTIDTVVRKGAAMAEITRFCEKIEPDLVAVGSQRHRFLDRLLLGSVARSVAADGRWSTLVTPPARAERA